MTKSRQDQHDQHLPPEVAERLRAAARRRTEGTTPFPRVELAVRRDRRRRATGTAVAAAALLVAATVVTGAVRSDDAPAPADRGNGPTPTVIPTPAPEPTPPRTPPPGAAGDPYSLTGPTAGSLGGDQAWLRGLRQRVVDAGKASDTSQVRVLWATDHEGVRYALTTARLGLTWTLQGWRGGGAAPPDRMGAYSESGFAPAGGTQQQFQAEFKAFRPGEDRSTGPGLLVVVGRGLSDVEVASGFDYTSGGAKTARWQPLRPEAAVWWSAADAAQIDAMTVRARFPDGLRRPVAGEGTYGQAPELPGMAGVAPAGTNGNVLACAAMAFAPERGGFPKGSTPILGGTPREGDQWYGVAVARAPGGGYLVGTCRTLHPEWSNSSGAETPGSFVVPAPRGGADRFLTVMPVNTGSPAADESAQTATKLVAIAPVGATEVEFGGVTAPVRDRLAVVTFPDRTPIDDLRVTARDAAGRSLGTAGVAATEEEAGQGSFYDVTPAGVRIAATP